MDEENKWLSGWEIVFSIFPIIKKIEESDRLDKTMLADELRMFCRKRIDCSDICPYALECIMICDKVVENE
jgi:hypothetical protein